MMQQPRLSFCIATFNRAHFLAATLESIIAQATSDCEIVVSDNASTDNTESVVADYARRFERLQYFRQDINRGLDRNFDQAVELANGEYCWLMPDDDLLKPGAVAAVFKFMRSDVSLIAVNVDFMDFTMSRVVQRGVDFQSDRFYEPEDMDRLFMDAAWLNGYIGSFIMRRSIWLARNRERYFGSYCIHIGVIYQEWLPGRALVTAEPLISMRMGNVHDWWSGYVDILLRRQALVESLALSESTKRKASYAELWNSPRLLLWLRAINAYSAREYRRKIYPRVRSVREMVVPALIALLPAALMNALYAVYYRVVRRARGNSSADWYLQVLRESRLQHRGGRSPFREP